MAKPTKKAPGIEEFLMGVTGTDRRKAIRADVCSICKGEATTFRDAISEREYTISGWCQKCQDRNFGGDDES